VVTTMRYTNRRLLYFTLLYGIFAALATVLHDQLFGFYFYHVPKFACCLLYNVHAVRLAVSPSAKIKGVSKNSPTVLGRFWNKVHQILAACRGVHVD